MTHDELRDLCLEYFDTYLVETAAAIAEAEACEAEAEVKTAPAATSGPIRLHYAVRDIATQGTDFLVWGCDEIGADSADMQARAFETLNRALRDGLDVELVVTRLQG